MIKMKEFIEKQVNTIFSRTFTGFFISEPMARSYPPLAKREPEMPQEILDLID